MPSKKYSINWENDDPVSFEVDGVTYTTLDEIPNPKDRERLASMLGAAEDAEFDKKAEAFDREFAQAVAEQNKNSVNIEKLILTIFSGVAVLMLAIALFASFSAIRKMSGEASAEGRVVEMVKRREYVNEQDRVYTDYYYPVVEFLGSDGRRRSVQMAEGSSPASYEVGDQVTVLYDPEHPLDARIKSFGSAALMWVLPVITGTLGLAFLGAVIVVRKLIPPTGGETSP